MFSESTFYSKLRYLKEYDGTGEDLVRIVFSDIDGVLNTPFDKERIGGIFEVKRLSNLIKLIHQTGSVLVIISRRRFYEEERKNIDSVFNERDVQVDYLQYEKSDTKRSDEILDYLDNHEDISEYVIIDDNDYGYSKNPVLSCHYVNACAGGLSMAVYKKACAILVK